VPTAKPQVSHTRQGAKGEQSAKFFCCLALCSYVTTAGFSSINGVPK
jgi:hypothetical protein